MFYLAAARNAILTGVNRTTTVITGATILAGIELRRVEDVALVIENGTIVSIVPQTEAPDDAMRVDATGTMLMPGFIDAHVHIGFYDPAQIVSRGVTTARDLGWPPERIYPLVEASRDPGFEGPTILAAGPMLTVPLGYPTRAAWAPPGTGRVVTSRDDAKEAVARTAREGASVIKVALNPAVGPTLDGGTLGTIVTQAHERDLKVTGHVTGLKELDKALDAGVDELAHMLMGPRRIPARTIERMVSSGMTIVPTLSIRVGLDRRIAIDNLKRFFRAGGRVVYGTDLGNAGPRPGIEKREVTAMAKAGMSAREIVASATVDSAAYLGLDNTGALDEGRDADIVAIGGDALDDVKALTNVRMVWRKGRRVR